MKRIYLTQDKFTLVSDEDFEELSKYKWHAHKDNRSPHTYASRKEKIGGKWRTIRMHRQVLGLQLGDEREGDHKNRNTLDNRRDNLRICSKQENLENRY